MKNIFKLSGALAVVAVGLAGCGGGGDGTFIPKADTPPSTPNTTPGGTTPGGTTGTPGTPGGTTVQLFTQQERLARPIVNEVLATVAQRRHRVNNIDNPTDDQGQLSTDIESFLTFPAGRSRATKDVIKSVLVPDVMIVDLRQTGQAAYLGVETGGATGSKFGGRKLQDDVVDTSLGIVFGNTVSALKLAPDDGKEIPTLTSDNVDASGHNYSSSFPYLESPN